MEIRRKKRKGKMTKKIIRKRRRREIWTDGSAKKDLEKQGTEEERKGER